MTRIDAYSSDAEIRRYLRAQKRRRIRIRVASRLGVLIVIMLMAVYLLVSGVQALFGLGNSLDNPAAGGLAAGDQTQQAKSSDKAENDKKDSDVTPVKIRGTIFIDAGHGGSDPGAESGSRMEKEDTLSMALAIRHALEAKGYKVVMSRTDDSTVDRKKRGQMANDCGAGLMVSIHRNKSETTGNGVEMYISSKNSQQEQLLAGNIMKQLETVGISYNRGVRPGTLPDPKDDYEENRMSNMPSVLIEYGFISNQEDNRLFDTKKADYAEATAKGIDETFKALYESETASSGQDGQNQSTSGESPEAA